MVESLSRDGIVALGAVMNGSVVLAPSLDSSLAFTEDDRVVAVRPSSLREIELVIESETMMANRSPEAT